MSRTIIISPSGNLYGSENVLLDFLQNTENIYTVYIKTKGLLFKKATKISKHIIKNYNSEKSFYLKLIFILLIKRKIRIIYVNEGGHVRYIKLLAKIFPKRNFFVHIRIKEDTHKQRLTGLSKNVKLIVISKYIVSLINQLHKTILIYDPYKITKDKATSELKNEDKFNIAIVGRITKTKQLDNLFPILNSLQNIKNIRFNFWGHYDETNDWYKTFKNKTFNYSNFEFIFKGFNENQNEIYANTDLILHLNTTEALGRIVFEAVDFNIPIITFDKGGTGELMKMLGFDELIVKKDDRWQEKFAKKILSIIQGKNYNKNILNAKKIIKKEFTPKKYTNKIEELFNI